MLEGVWGGDDLCVWYNNNPYANGGTRRDGELAGVRRWVAGNPRVAELGYAEYPERGPCEGYSFALLLVCDPDEVDDLEDRVWAEHEAALKDLFRTRAGGGDVAPGG